MVALVDLDPRMNDAHIEPDKDLCPIPLQDDDHSTHMGTLLTAVVNTMVSQAFIKNTDLVAWTASNMSRVSLDIITHYLSMYKEAWTIAQKKRKTGEEKRNAARSEIDKLVKVVSSEKHNTPHSW